MENNNNIISIDDLKTSKRKSRSRKDDLTPAMKQDMISHYIDDTIQNPVGKSPNKKFVCLSPDGIQKLVYEIRGQEVIKSDEAAVLNMLGESIKEHFVNDIDLHMTASQYEGAVEYWKMQAATMADPKLIAWKGEDCLAFRMIPFEIGLGDTPLFDEMMVRTSNSEALMCFIGSLFFIESDLQQYVWIHGQGGEGKGALCRFLYKALGHLYSSQQIPKDDRFWTHGIRGARLVVFPDCNNTKWVADGMFKALTGGDPVRVEKKGKDVWTEKMFGKYMFLSNEKPDVSSEKADKRRLIYCEMTPYDGIHSPTYEDRLFKEGGYFLSKCCALYMSKYPDFGPINADNELLDDVIATNEEHFSEFFDSNFLLDPDKCVEPFEFNFRLKMEFKTKKEQKDFRMWMERTYGVRRKTVRFGDTSEKSSVHTNNKTPKAYKGIKVKLYEKPDNTKKD